MPSFAESSEGDSDGSIASLSLKRSVEAGIYWHYHQSHVQKPSFRPPNDRSWPGASFSVHTRTVGNTSADLLYWKNTYIHIQGRYLLCWISVANPQHPFQCDQCAESFSKSKELTTHKDEIHADLKPFKCSFFDCNFRCKKLSYFRRHESLHLQPNPFKVISMFRCWANLQ